MVNLVTRGGFPLLSIIKYFLFTSCFKVYETLPKFSKDYFLKILLKEKVLSTFTVLFIFCSLWIKEWLIYIELISVPFNTPNFKQVEFWILLATIWFHASLLQHQRSWSCEKILLPFDMNIHIIVITSTFGPIDYGSCVSSCLVKFHVTAERSCNRQAHFDHFDFELVIYMKEHYKFQQKNDLFLLVIDCWYQDKFCNRFREF